METTSLQHILIESRITILDLLHNRGYNTEPYRKIIGPELLKLVNTPESLRMTLEQRDEAVTVAQDGEKVRKKAIVEYAFSNIKLSVGTGDYVHKLLNEPSESVSKSQRATMLHSIDPKTTEVIVLYLSKSHGEDTESYDKGALEAWQKHQFRIQFFHMPRLVINPLKHVLQPKFEIVPVEEHASLMKEWYCRNKSQLPLIKFHNDMAARCLGLSPGDIVKITSFSPTAGEYVKYRVCTP